MTYLAKCPECGGTICTSKTEIRDSEKLFCDHCKKPVYCLVGYLPDDPKNKVFAVDTYVTVVKCIKVEAKDDEEAKRLVEDRLNSSVLNLFDGEDCMALANMGFHGADELKTRVSGSTDENGEIHYN